MSQTLIFLRHEQTEPTSDPTKPVEVLPIAKWNLTSDGENRARMRADEKGKEFEEFKDVDVIIASTEDKAYKTVQHLAKKLGKEVLREPEIRELERPGFMEKPEYERAAEAALRYPDRAAADGKWETALHALERFEKAIERIKEMYPGKKVLIVGHAYTMNLYFAKLRGELDRVYERYHSNNFGDWGKIVDGKIVKDLANGTKERAGEKMV